MPDYNLFGLSPRSFEQLVQAIATKVIGPNVVIFGDGPDGAREATFSGKLNYPSKQPRWNGDGIVQAKFLQRSSGKPKQDADWLLHQLAEEMKKFSKRGSKSKKKRAAPDYYVLATNVTLSPKAETGGKDRVAAALNKYQKTLGWKASDVWDADKISRLLDGHRDIATTYAAWITAGDVLEAVITSLKGKRSDFQEVMFTFLQKELMAAQYANLRQAGHTDQERVALSRVFVDLPVSERQWLEPPDETKGNTVLTNFVAELLNQGSYRLSQTESGQFLFADIGTEWRSTLFKRKARWKLAHVVNELTAPISEPLKIELEKAAAGLIEGEKESELLKSSVFVSHFTPKTTGLIGWISDLAAGLPRPGRIVLLGGPGQGKTTLGQFACQIYRASVLEGARRGVAREVREALHLIREQCGRSVPIPSGRRYPLHIDLKALAAFLATHDTDNPPSLLEFIRERISRRVSTEVSGADIKLWLKEYPWFVVFDGLDEVPATGNREGTIKCINEFLVDVDALDADVLVLATCRPQSYAKEFDEKHYRHLWLIPLSDARALDYGNRLLAVRHPPGADLDTYKGRLAAAVKTPATARLMRSPLQVTIMAALVERVGLPPEQRWSLFSEYYRVTYDRETERGTKWSAALRDYRTDVDLIHRHIGFLVHQKGEGTAGVEASLSEADFRQVVAERLAKEGHSGAELNTLVDLLCEAVKDRLVFLAVLTEKRIGFEIRSLQEFMAGDYLMDAPDAAPAMHDEAVSKSLATIATAPHWRNVFLFAAGRIYAREQRFRDSLEALCHRLNESDEDPATCMNLGGSRLALDLLEDGSARNQPKSSKLLTRAAARLLDLPPCEAHRRLTHQINLNTESVIREELERRLASTSDGLWASAWACLNHFCRRGTPWALELLNRFVPEDPNHLAIAMSVTRATEHETPLTNALSARGSQAYILDWLRWHHQEERVVTLIPKTPGGSPFTTVAKAALAQTRHSASSKGGVPGPMRVITAKLALQQGLSFHLNTTGMNSPALPTHEEASRWHGSWKAFLAGLRFAKNPSAGTLASELEWLLQDWEVSGLRPRQRIAPWQLAACLDACESPEDLQLVTERARAGDLGDAEHWQAAELRWSSTGVTIQDLLHVSASGPPFDKNISSEGFPFQIAGMINEGGAQQRMVEELLDVFPQVKDAFAKRRLGRFITLLQFLLQRHKDERADIDFSMSLLRRSLRLGIEVDPQWALLATNRAAFSATDLEFYDELGRAAFTPKSHAISERSWGKLADGFTTGLAKAFVQAPRLVGLLRLLAFCQPDWANKTRVPLELLDGRCLEDRPLKCAGLVVRLDQLAWAQDEAATLAEAAVAALEERPDIIERACGVIESSTGTSPEKEAFLVALLPEIPEVNWRMRGRVVEALNALLARRSAASV